MNTKSSNKDYSEIKKSFDEIFSFNGNYDDQIENDAHLIMAKFLSEIEKSMAEKKILKKTLAEKIGTSASYLTQLFRGHKLINLITLAKIQKELEIEFNIYATDSNINLKQYTIPPSISLDKFLNDMSENPKKLLVIHSNLSKLGSVKPEYDNYNYDSVTSVAVAL